MLDERKRLEALAAYAILDTPPEADFDDLVRLAATICGTPIALVTLIDAQRQWYKARHGLDIVAIDRAQSFCMHLLDTPNKLLIVPDARADTRFAANAMVLGEPYIRFYAGAPLVSPEGAVLGSLCVVDQQLRPISAEQQEALRVLGRQVMTQLELRRQIAEQAAANRALQREIAERRKVEEELRQSQYFINRVAASFPSTLYVFDLSAGRNIYVNQELSILLGYTPGQAVQRGSRLLETLIHPNDQARVAAAHRRLRTSSDGEVIETQYRARHADGSWRWVSSRDTVFQRDPAGAVLQILGSAQDITERRQVEEQVERINADLERQAYQLTEANRELEESSRSLDQANRAKSEFLSRMSHELRTPLNAILGFAQLIGLDPLAPAQTEGLSHILKAGRHLLSLIDEVLDFARIEAGRLHISLEPVQVGEVLAEALDLITPIAHQHQVTLQPCPPDCSAHYVLADRQRLSQVLLNLLSNAVKYNRSGGEVFCTATLTAAGALRITVHDTGPGIAAELQSRLFTPFERLGAERSAIEGTGLGLALCKRLADAMHGSIGLSSLLGQGSEFWIELAVAQSLAHIAHSPSEPSSPVVADGGEYSVLYIEDNLSNLQLVERILDREPGIRLITAMQGRLGLDLARQHPLDLILLDLDLPDLDGMLVLARLRAAPETRNIPVLVISADGSRGQDERLRAAGAWAYLSKPLDVQQFLSLVRAVLRQ